MTKSDQKGHIDSLFYYIYITSDVKRVHQIGLDSFISAFHLVGWSALLTCRVSLAVLT